MADTRKVGEESTLTQCVHLQGPAPLECGGLDTGRDPPGEVFSYSETEQQSRVYWLGQQLLPNCPVNLVVFCFFFSCLDLRLLEPFLGAKGDPRFLREEIC